MSLQVIRTLYGVAIRATTESEARPATAAAMRAVYGNGLPALDMDHSDMVKNLESGTPGFLGVSFHREKIRSPYEKTATGLTVHEVTGWDTSIEICGHDNQRSQARIDFLVEELGGETPDLGSLNRDQVLLWSTETGDGRWLHPRIKPSASRTKTPEPDDRRIAL